MSTEYLVYNLNGTPTVSRSDGRRDHLSSLIPLTASGGKWTIEDIAQELEALGTPYRIIEDDPAWPELIENPYGLGKEKKDVN